MHSTIFYFWMELLNFVANYTPDMTGALEGVDELTAGKHNTLISCLIATQSLYILQVFVRSFQHELFCWQQHNYLGKFSSLHNDICSLSVLPLE